MASIYRLPSTLMRGGTSKGLFIRSDALPEDTSTWERMLLRAIGSPTRTASRSTAWAPAGPVPAR